MDESDEGDDDGGVGRYSNKDAHAQGRSCRAAQVWVLSSMAEVTECVGVGLSR